MKKSKSMFVLALIVSVSLSLFACGNSNNQKEVVGQHDHEAKANEAGHAMSESVEMTMKQNSTITILIDNYLEIKNALVQDNSKAAANAGQKLSESALQINLASYDATKQAEIKEILEVVKVHGEHIAKSEIAHQREHFESMAKDFVDLIALTGTDRTLYQQYCPMFNKGKGGSWLSTSSEIQNPLFGSKMLTCGSVKETISMK
ncbi:DUF3347 domain-containing protein [Chondrinema litorale]|uniref:DUF3347 domain-containing protein n=1 Tax=Chondrinema litorale TaxID=2994555 RepID=UPI00254336BA|nr:DUF3347 domain-containing protein [Chondrinema litorale]UZR98921.1 DUF3347 domain-containing protein [Chondrinema litorale]